MGWFSKGECRGNAHDWDLKYTQKDRDGNDREDHYECRNCGERRSIRL